MRFCAKFLSAMTSSRPPWPLAQTSGTFFSGGESWPSAETMRMRPGDLQWLNNHVILHSRTAFVDHDDPARRRHLLRLWLALPEGHALPEGWRPGYGAVTARTVRGGLRGSAIGPDFLDYERRLAAHHRMALAT